MILRLTGRKRAELRDRIDARLGRLIAHDEREYRVRRALARMHSEPAPLTREQVLPALMELADATALDVQRQYARP